jgi:hypothetical protein
MQFSGDDAPKYRPSVSRQKQTFGRLERPNIVGGVAYVSIVGRGGFELSLFDGWCGRKES